MMLIFLIKNYFVCVEIFSSSSTFKKSLLLTEIFFVVWALFPHLVSVMIGSYIFSLHIIVDMEYIFPT